MRHVLAIVVSLLAVPTARAASIEVKHLDAAAALVLVEGDLELVKRGFLLARNTLQPLLV